MKKSDYAAFIAGILFGLIAGLIIGAIVLPRYECQLNGGLFDALMWIRNHLPEPAPPPPAIGPAPV